ncbi:CDGSH iron-sulfur domain-containing protein 3, mitochondrial-like [Liolophura sinensis]|uniref:CDGSH iron-sulfur domain-containing protein 3, mitochondrial-like n=1 Tax=Liolophura sinensis TaxID=3198878 RepID=UPI003159519C
MALQVINLGVRTFRGPFSAYCQNLPAIQAVRHLKVEDFDQEKYEKRVHPETPQYPQEYSLEPAKGKIYDKKPFKMTLTAGKKYSWCTCGTSKNQPLCDGNHKTIRGTSTKKTSPKFVPLRFTVEETKDYWLCNCKQTSNRPFCDGTHKQEDIQSAVRS